MERPRRDDILDVVVDDLAFGAQGVARVDGFVVFCDDTAPGDRARVRVRRARRRFAEARLEEIIDPGPDRIEPRCDYVPQCGGCRLQHVRYERTLVAKRDQIREHLGRIGHLHDVAVLDPDPAVEVFGYRNKMEYSVAPDGSGGRAIGFHRRGRWDSVVDVTQCHIATGLSNRLRESVRVWASDCSIEPYDQREQVGMLRHVVTRVAVTTDQAVVTIVTAPDGQDLVDRLVDHIRRDCPEVVGVVHAVNDGVAEVTAGLESRVVWGRDYVEESIHGITLRLSAGAFFQTNTRMATTLYSRAIEAAGLTGDEVLYDLYAGAGSMGLILAPHAREVVAVEIVPEAVEDARANAERNGLSNYRALCGDVRVVLREQRDELPRPDVAIVDPPRAGLSGGAVRRILELEPPVLVYVSCQPATFADNARRFVDGGYTLEWVRPVDMFPQTPHIEAVARFTRSG